MATKKSLEGLALIIALQMAGFIVLEIVFWLLLVAGIMPPALILKRTSNVVIYINSGYLVIAGLMAVLVSGFWLALLSEVFGLVEIKKVSIKI